MDSRDGMSGYSTEIFLYFWGEEGGLDWTPGEKGGRLTTVGSGLSRGEDGQE